MGIIVPDLVLVDQDLNLPNAYVAISKNSVVLTPRNNHYDVYTNYNVWTSLQARLADKKPIYPMALPLQFVWQGTTTASLDDLYAAAYDRIKVMYPTYVDELATAADPTPLATAADPTPLATADPTPLATTDTPTPPPDTA